MGPVPLVQSDGALQRVCDGGTHNDGASDDGVGSDEADLRIGDLHGGLAVRAGRHVPQVTRVPATATWCRHVRRVACL